MGGPADASNTSLHALAPETRLVTGGRDPFSHHGFVNPPVYHASTVLYPDAADMIAHRGRYQYGRSGTPTSDALQQALMALEGPQCAGVALLPSGLAAVTIALLSVLKAGDHLLLTDSCYRPARQFADGMLARLGVETTYYAPLIGKDIAALFRPNTRLVYTEAPGSQTFEMQDVPTIAAVAHGKGALLLTDNTWGTQLFRRPLEQGADLVVMAGTKYIGGHSDIMLGTVAANAVAWPQLEETVATLGLCVGPDDMYLALRGLRTMGVRLARHQESALAVARWLERRPEVLHVMHPGLESDPGHAVWKRDFSGSSGLFGAVLKPTSEAALHAFLNALKLFGMGFSWGGCESLVIAYDCSAYRTATRYAPGGQGVRFHVGLEDVGDLIADLEQAFAKMAAAAA